MKALWWFAAGLGAAAGLAQFATWRRTRAVAAGIDLNTCSREDLLRLPGMRDDLADRVLDNRPYRSKFDLLNRLIIPDTVYSRIRSRVRVDEDASHRSVQIA
jgi:hypothetical protein